MQIQQSEELLSDIGSDCLAKRGVEPDHFSLSVSSIGSGLVVRVRGVVFQLVRVATLCQSGLVMLFSIIENLLIRRQVRYSPFHSQGELFQN